jgi:hypothetical protein
MQERDGGREDLKKPARRSAVGATASGKRGRRPWEQRHRGSGGVGKVLFHGRRGILSISILRCACSTHAQKSRKEKQSPSIDSR